MQLQHSGVRTGWRHAGGSHAGRHAGGHAPRGAISQGVQHAVVSRNLHLLSSQGFRLEMLHLRLLVSLQPRTAGGRTQAMPHVMSGTLAMQVLAAHVNSHGSPGCLF